MARLRAAAQFYKGDDTLISGGLLRFRTGMERPMNLHPVRLTSLLSGLILLLNTGALAMPTRSGPDFADPAFKSTWARTDLPVANGTVKRSYYWGPQPISDAILEDSAGSPGGKHLVQYFDKSRMEINNPNGDKSNPFYVTNGRLAVELITGEIQENGYPYKSRWPAYIPLGDNTGNDSEITYASFRAALNTKSAPNVGAIVQKEIVADGPLDLISPGTLPSIGAKYNVKYAYYESVTGRGIPDVFWSFLNTTGPVIQDGEQVTARLNDPYFYATGYPISDAYWARLTVGGVQVDALLQAYERRVLTYVPGAPEGFKVQMDNVGQHYYDWRYKDAGKPPALAGHCQENAVRGFGKVYAANDIVKIHLGCQLTGEDRQTVVRQTFQQGQMISVARVENYTNRLREDVYVLVGTGANGARGDSPARAFQVYKGYVGDPNATPTPIPAPPQRNDDGFYTPTGTFGDLWNSDPYVHSLGQATSPPDIQAKAADGSGGGVVQYFKGGLMVYPNVSIRRIYVLYNSGGYAYISNDPVGRVTPTTNIDYWTAYDDTFTS
jgi:type II secretory pathway pseudopilin PulG